MGYTTVAELRSQLNDTRDLNDSGELQAAIDAASREIDEHCGRNFDLDASASTRLYEPSGSTRLPIDDIGSTSGLIVEYSADGSTYTMVAASNYELLPLNASSAAGGAYAWWWLAEAPAATTSWAWARRVRVSARWGWSAVPAQVRQACLIRAAAIYKRRESPQGVAGFGEFGVVRLRADPDVAILLQPFVRVEL